MFRILKHQFLVPNIFEMEIEAPEVARKAEAGRFVIVMADEQGERIPLTIADWDVDRGTITLVIMVVGTSSMKLSRMKEGDSLYAFAGPFGHPSEIEDFGTIIMVAGGVGTAPIYPIARALKERGNRIITIQGARSENLLFWQDKLASVSDEHIVTTDDGTVGRKALVTEPLKELLEQDTDGSIGCVYAIGPAIMMKFCSLTTQPFKVKTIVSLNSIMVDGTGMCGGCRVDVGGDKRFASVDGPEFDGHVVDWEVLMKRQTTYCEQEKCSLDQYKEQVGVA